MSKQILIEVIAGKANITKAAAEAAVNAFTDYVTSELKKGEKFAITGFGGWEVNFREARMGRDPKSGKPIQISSAYVPKFRAGKKLKEAVNERAK